MSECTCEHLIPLSPSLVNRAADGPERAARFGEPRLKRTPVGGALYRRIPVDAEFKFRNPPYEKVRRHTCRHHVSRSFERSVLERPVSGRFLSALDGVRMLYCAPIVSTRTER